MIINENDNHSIKKSTIVEIAYLDKKSRFLKVLEDSDWHFQFTGEKPKKMIKGTVIHISRLVKHKMIKGTTKLTVQVLEVL